MNSKFFPFKKPFYKDLIFYGFLYLIYIRLSDDLINFVEYGYGNLALQLFEILAGAILISWIYAILLSGLRHYISNWFIRLKSRRETIEAKQNSGEVFLTKFDKPITEMTPEERDGAIRKHAERFFKRLNVESPE
jgi:multidrug efflux pump subunit AcrB